MTKKFNPKITPGPWDIFEDREFSGVYSGNGETIFKIQNNEDFHNFPYGNDLSAILAIPEMLAVVRAAREISSFSLNWKEDVDVLQRAIQKLDEKHGTEVEK